MNAYSRHLWKLSTRGLNILQIHKGISLGKKDFVLTKLRYDLSVGIVWSTPQERLKIAHRQNVFTYFNNINQAREEIICILRQKIKQGKMK